MRKGEPTGESEYRDLINYLEYLYIFFIELVLQDQAQELIYEVLS